MITRLPFALALLLPAVAAAEPREGRDAAALVERFGGEPTVRALQRAAVLHAEADPARVRTFVARARRAALAPEVRVSGGYSRRELRAVSGYDGLERISADDGNTFRVDASLSWSLDRLVFDRAELQLADEAQRLAARREAVATEVARLYFQRRRLQLQLHLAPPADANARLDLELRIAELGAILDGITGGALTRRGAQPWPTQ